MRTLPAEPVSMSDKFTVSTWLNQPAYILADLAMEDRPLSEFKAAGEKLIKKAKRISENWVEASVPTKLILIPSDLEWKGDKLTLRYMNGYLVAMEFPAEQPMTKHVVCSIYHPKEVTAL